MRQLIYILFLLSSLLIGLSAIYRLSYKADLPFKYHSEINKIISDTSYNEIQIFDKINSINNFPVNSLFETEFFIDTKYIDEEVSLNVTSENSNTKIVKVKLSNYYHDIFFILITLIVGISYWSTGVYVYIFGRNELSARILCLTLVSISMAVFTSPCFFGRGDDWMGYLIRISHSVSYLFGGLFLLHFSLIFPAQFSKSQNKLLKILYGFIFISSVVVSYYQFISMKDLNSDYMKIYSFLWDFTQLFLVLSLVISSALLIIKYKRLSTKKEKSKLEWLFWGLSAGAGPFIILWLIPSIFGLNFPVIEEILLSFLILIPISFAIAVVKYHLFDIEVVIKRSIIYSLMLVFMIIMYFGIVYGLSFLTGQIMGENSGIFNIIAVVIIALAFNPARVKLKNYVDIIFYRQKYSFDKAISDLNRKIANCNSVGILGDVLINEINSLIPVKSIAVCILTPDRERLRIAAQDNFDNMSKYISALRVKKIFAGFIYPFAVKDKVERNISIDRSLEKVFMRWNIDLGIPLVLESENVIGVILLGSKLSELKYSSSDIELLCNIGSAASLALIRLQLQEQIFREEMEIQNLREVNKMKSYFVATVSHDLKTPLSSIKIFSDLLGKENITPDKKKEYLNYIDGETDRLNRMINNILNYAKIEKGIKNHNLIKINVNEVLSKVLKDMTYDLLLNKFEVVNKISDEELHIKGDPDDMNSLFENLISNVIKYSGKTKYLKVNSFANHKNAHIEIEDKGIGISSENLNDIFDPYFRGKKIEQSRIKGTGLGLAIVKNIIDAHNGIIEVKSEPGIGTTFILTLPLYKNEN